MLVRVSTAHHAVAGDIDDVRRQARVRFFQQQRPYLQHENQPFRQPLNAKLTACQPCSIPALQSEGMHTSVTKAYSSHGSGRPVLGFSLSPRCRTWILSRRAITGGGGSDPAERRQQC